MDEDIARIAERQHGVFTDRQAREAGLTRSAIRHRLDRRRFLEVLPRVYRFEGAPMTPHAEVTAAVLACGDSAAASGHTAAALHGLPGFTLLPPQVSVPRRPPRVDLDVVETFVLLPHHRSAVLDIPTTSVSRTLFDLCGLLPRARVERALDTALARKLVTVQALWRVLHDLAQHGRAGTRLLRTLLLERGVGYVPPESELEARFIALVRDHGLPEPERQVDLGDNDHWIGRVDFMWRDARLVVEVDGAAFHRGLVDQRADGERDAALGALGVRVLRFTWDDVSNNANEVAATLRDALTPIAAVGTFRHAE